MNRMTTMLTDEEHGVLRDWVESLQPGWTVYQASEHLIEHHLGSTPDDLEDDIFVHNVRAADIYTMPLYGVPTVQSVTKVTKWIENAIDGTEESLRYLRGIGTPSAEVMNIVHKMRRPAAIRAAAIKAIQATNINWKIYNHTFREIQTDVDKLEVQLLDVIASSKWPAAEPLVAGLISNIARLNVLGVDIWLAIEACADLLDWLDGPFNIGSGGLEMGNRRAPTVSDMDRGMTPSEIVAEIEAEREVTDV